MHRLYPKPIQSNFASWLILIQKSRTPNKPSVSQISICSALSEDLSKADSGLVSLKEAGEQAFLSSWGGTGASDLNATLCVALPTAATLSSGKGALIKPE